MTDKTATQNLTRTQSTDAPRKFASYLRTLRDEVDQRMAAHLFDLDRSLNVPACRLSLNTPITVLADSNARTEFDTVDLDTDGMADLSANAKRITFQTVGYYVVGTSLLLALGSGPAHSEWRIGTAGSFGGLRGVGDPNDVSQPKLGNSSALEVKVTVPGTSYIEQSRGTFNTSYTTWTFNHATLWAYKVRDL